MEETNMDYKRQIQKIRAKIFTIQKISNNVADQAQGLPQESAKVTPRERAAKDQGFSRCSRTTLLVSRFSKSELA